MSGPPRDYRWKDSAVTRIAVLVAGLVLLAGGLAAARAQTDDAAAPAGNAQNGKMLYSDKTCERCHGMAGEGDTGPQIAPPPAYSHYIDQLRNPIDKMPAFSKDDLSDAQAADIYAFLKSIGGSAANRPSGHAAAPVKTATTPSRSSFDRFLAGLERH
jgi:mono/diheme cytochrome c family protein